MSDEQDRAESLDEEVLADDQPTNDDRFEELPAEDEYPPEEPQGVLDPGRYEIEDDVETRSSREVDETGESAE